MSQSPSAPEVQGIVGKAGRPSAAFLAAKPSVPFKSGWRLCVGNEGGYVDNPQDPGGATNWGVTERVARKWGYEGRMQDLPQPYAEAIGYLEYWKPYRLDQLHPVIAEQVFDGIYNSDPKAAVRWLQASCGAFEDGDLGPMTVQAANSVPVPTLVARYDARRLLYLADLEKWPSFGRGWARRIGNNLLQGEA